MTEPQFLPLKPADEPETSGVVSLECGVCYEGGDPGIMVVTTCGSIVFGFLAFAHCLIIGHTAYAGEVDKAERAALLGLWVMDAVQLIVMTRKAYICRKFCLRGPVRLYPQNRLECGVCYEDCDPGIMVVTTCGHLFCASCMRGLVEFAAKKMAGLLKCAGCLRPLNLNEIIPLQGQKGVKNPWLNAKNLKIPQPKFVYYQASKEFFHPLVIQAFFCLLLAIAHFAIGACTVWKKESSIAGQIGMMFLWTMDFAQMVAMGYYTAYFLYQSAMMNHPNR
ncbi:unnamed protein product, partial [Mesorhabditis spiculigera]